MANELKINASLEFEKDGASVSTRPANNVKIDITGNKSIKNTQTIGTTEETLVLGDVASVRKILVRNLDLNNYVELGVATGVYGERLRAGDISLLSPNGNTIYAKANTAAVVLEYTAVDS